VEQLQVSRIIVLGHAHCGGIRALMDRRTRGDGETDYLERWMDIAEPARRQVLQQMPQATAAERRRACEQASILISLRNLEDLPFVRRAVEAGSLTLHGWYFDLVAGALLAYSARADAFLPIVCPLFTELA
jgi:carbonic anhydrase